MNKQWIQTGILIAIIVAVAFTRLIPHTFNFSPLGAIGLFGAAYFSKRWLALLIPITATWMSDLFLNNVVYAQYYPQFTWFYGGFYWQYGSYVLIVLGGILLFHKINPTRVIGGALMASAIFFLVSNFGVWIGSKVYPQNISGLLTCYGAGLPFIKGTLMGDLFYSTVLFGGYELLCKFYPSLAMHHRKLVA